MGHDDETDAFGRTRDELERGWLPPAGAQPPGPGPERPEGWEPPAPAAGPAEAKPGTWPPSAPSPSSATTSLVLGVVGLIICPVICSVPAIVLGRKARREIDASGGRLGGRGNATAGIVLGWLGVGLAIALLLLVGLGATVDETPTGA